MATLLLEHAIKAIRDRGGEIAEGYPVKAYDYGKAIPAAFAWTGTQTMFKKNGFKPVGSKAGGKQRMRSSP